MELLQQIHLSGVVGAGGAGFPTHKKLVQDARLLLVNAAECEPLLCSDRYVMRRHAREVISALATVKQELNIGRVVIGTKAKYNREIEALQAEIQRQGAAIDVYGVKSFYPAGDEQALIYEVTGESVPPGGLPIALGIVVINVTTAFHIYNALQGEPVTWKYVTVTGEVTNPCIVKVPVGTPVLECIAAAGGAVCGSFMVVMGGPMMGRHYKDSQIEALNITKTDGGVIVLPVDHCLPVFKSKKLEHIVNQARSACIQCSFCTEQCPRYLLGHPLKPNRIMRAVATGVNPKELKEALLCSECGICELHACPMSLSPRQVNIHIKNLLRQTNIRPSFSLRQEQTTMREYRRIDQTRLIARLDLRTYPTRLDQLVKYTPQKVTIPLKQSIGKAAQAVVKEGDRVAAGDPVGVVEFAEVGSVIHASIAGIVTEAGPDAVTVVKEVEGL